VTVSLNRGRPSGYLRPQDQWVCGHLAAGKPCPLGPDRKGRCGAADICKPWNDGVRFQCRRSAQLGGPCEHGPFPNGRCGLKIEPCTPEPTLSKKRQRITFWLTGLVIGLLALILAGGNANELLMPGPLATSHASLTDCQSCHAGSFSGNLSWLHNLVDAAPPHKSAELCLNCHEVGENAVRPHTHPVAQLRALTEKVKARAAAEGEGPGDAFRPVLFRAPASMTQTEEATVFCASCHSEHQGVDADLTLTSNAQCQTCHARRFGEFGSSHPNLADYPFNRRTRINFNHQSHFARHFPETRRDPALGFDGPTECATCHRTGSGQLYMEIATFDAMCGSCHTKDIRGVERASGPKGIDFLVVPGLDLLTLEERGIDIGSWPEDAEARATSFMRWMLAISLDGRDIISELSHLDLLDLRSATDAEFETVRDLAWATKDLFQRIETVGLKSVMELPKNSDGSAIDAFQFANMTAVLPRDVISAANKQWFGTLKDDLARKNAGEPTAYFKTIVRTEPKNETGIGIRLETDRVSENGLLEDGLSEEGLLQTEDEGLEGDLEETGGLLEEAGSILEEEVGIDSNGLAETDLLGSSAGLEEEPDDDLSLEEDEADLDLSDGLEAGEDDGGGLLAIDGNGAEIDALSDSENASGSQEAPVVLNAEDWANMGGWYRDEFSIRYRPQGHADRFLRAWITYAGHAHGSVDETWAAPVFDAIAAPGANGRCMKCHSVDDENGMKHPKWRAFSTNRVKERFTVFSHQPHIRASGEEGCLMCHKPKSSVQGFDTTYLAGDPAVFAAQFKPVDKALCASCHTEESAGETCTMCHKYHATEFGRPMVRTELPFAGTAQGTAN